MHPAPSVILFTSLSGLGFGMLFWLGLGLPDVTGWTAFAFFTIAYLLSVGGLIASTTHLGHPERAWRAFSQWRSSWLSREGCAAVAALITMALYGIGPVFLETRSVLLGGLGALLSLGTVFTTAMIYTQLKSVPRWNQPATPVLFLSLSLGGGALLTAQIPAAIAFLALAGLTQAWHWRNGDTALDRSGTDGGTATGLGHIGTVRHMAPPHTGPNYLLTEMVHVVARKHATRLRVIGFTGMILLPLAVLIAFPAGHLAAAIAIVLHLAGVLTTRWLFFAEAEHVVGIYYGAR